MGTVCVCVWSGAGGCGTDGHWVHRGAQGHADSSRHPFTVKGQGGASCGLGLDDVAVRDLLSNNVSGRVCLDLVDGMRPRVSANYTLTRGGEVSARAHTCVAWGRCVAFGRPKMSVWGHAGAGSAPAKVACNTKVAHPNLEHI